MKIIFGLGNPGQQYKDNRHNIGYRVLEELANIRGAKLKRSFKLSAYLGEDNIYDKKVLLVKPRTFMNNSGLCVRKVFDKYKPDISDILIIYDDADLALGNIRFRERGSCAGHRGMSSVQSVLRTDEINRLRIGIGTPVCGELSDYVLSDFNHSEKELLDSTIDKSAAACMDWIEQGINFVMSKYNRRGGNSG